MKKTITFLLIFQAISTCGTVFQGLYYPYFLIHTLGYGIEQIAILATIRIAVGIGSEFFGGIVADNIGYRKTIISGTLFEVIGLIVLIAVSIGFFQNHITFGMLVLAVIFFALADIFWPGYYAILGEVDQKMEGDVFARLNMVWKWSSLLGALAFFISASRLGSWVFVMDLTTSIIFMLYILYSFRTLSIPLPEKLTSLSSSLWQKTKEQFSFMGNTTIIRLGLIQAIVLIIDGQLYRTVPVFWEQENMFGPRYLSLIVIIHSVTTILLQITVSTMLKKISTKKTLIVGIFIIVTGFFLRSTFGYVSLLVIGSLICAFGDMFLFPTISSAVAKVSKKDKKASSMSYFYTIQHLVGLLSPSIGVVILAFSSAVTGWIVLHLSVAILACLLVFSFSKDAFSNHAS